MRALYAARPSRRDASSPRAAPHSSTDAPAAHAAYSAIAPRSSRPWDDASQNTVGQARQSSAVHSAAAGQGRKQGARGHPQADRLAQAHPDDQGPIVAADVHGPDPGRGRIDRHPSGAHEFRADGDARARAEQRPAQRRVKARAPRQPRRAGQHGIEPEVVQAEGHLHDLQRERQGENPPAPRERMLRIAPEQRAHRHQHGRAQHVERLVLRPGGVQREDGIAELYQKRHALRLPVENLRKDQREYGNTDARTHGLRRAAPDALSHFPLPLSMQDVASRRTVRPSAQMPRQKAIKL